MQHHPGSREQIFDNDVLEKMVAEYQSTLDIRIANQIIIASLPILKALCRAWRTGLQCELGDVQSNYCVKLWKSLPLYSPDRGSLFSFCSRVAETTMWTAVGSARKQAAKFVPWDPDCNDRHFTKPEIDSAFELAEIEHKLRQVKSAQRDARVRASMRWLINSFVICDFHIPRHVAAEAITIVWPGIDRWTARKIYDELILSVRRELLPERAVERELSEKSRGRYGRYLDPYAEIIEPLEFAKLVMLLRGLSPTIVIAIKPENGPAIRRGDMDATRQNLEYILSGRPDATPLFGADDGEDEQVMVLPRPPHQPRL
jgi:hypothetical protein